MIIKDILISAATLLNLQEEVDILHEIEDVSQLSAFGDVVAGNIRSLLLSVNRVVAEIADFYLPLRTSATLPLDSQATIAYSDLPLSPAHFFSATCKGKKLNFKEFPDRLQFSTSLLSFTNSSPLVSIDYAYIPPTLSLLDSLPFREGCPHGRVVAFGIVAEYYLLTGQPDEAITWDKKYRDSLHAAMQNHKLRILPKRKWM